LTKKYLESSTILTLNHGSWTEEFKL